MMLELENEKIKKLRARIFNLVKHKIWNSQRNAAENEKDAEDITQDVLKTYWEKYFDESKGNLELDIRIVYQITYHKIGNHYKEKYKRMKVSNEDCEKLRDDMYTPLELIEEEDLRQIILKAIKQANKNYQKILKFLLEEKTRDQILSRFPNKSANTVDSWIHRCRKYLRKTLRELDYRI